MCLKSGKGKQMVSREGSGSDNLTIGLFQMEDPSGGGGRGGKRLWGISFQTQEPTYVHGPLTWSSKDSLTT